MQIWKCSRCPLPITWKIFGLLHCCRQLVVSSILENKCLGGLFYGSSCRKTPWGPFSLEFHFNVFNCINVWKWQQGHLILYFEIQGIWITIFITPIQVDQKIQVANWSSRNSRDRHEQSRLNWIETAVIIAVMLCYEDFWTPELLCLLFSEFEL